MESALQSPESNNEAFFRKPKAKKKFRQGQNPVTLLRSHRVLLLPKGGNLWRVPFKVLKATMRFFSESLKRKRNFAKDKTP